MTRALIVVEERLDHAGASSWAPLGAPLACVANRPLIAHVMQSLREAGAEGVVVVADHASASELRRGLAGEECGLGDVDWVELDAPVGVVSGLRAASRMLEGERFLVHRADALLIGGCDALRRSLADRESDATLVAGRGSATDLITLERMPAVHPAAGRDGESRERLDAACAFGPSVLDALRHVEPGRDGVWALLDAIRRETGLADIRTELADGSWQYVEGPQDLLDANRRVLDALRVTTDADRWPDSRLEGRVEVHATAELRGAVIRGPVVIGAGARVVDAYVGPYSAIGADAVVDNSEVESSILMAGASLCNAGVRVEESILGCGASVSRDFRLPRGMRLLVGADARVTLS